MTSNIKKMEAGPEMNALVATEIMEWKVVHDPLEDRDFYCKAGDDPEWTDFDYYIDEWKPSTDIAAAYTMEERIAELGLINRYCWELIKNAANKEEQTHTRQSWALIHATPEDRCRAALLATEKNDR